MGDERNVTAQSTEFRSARDLLAERNGHRPELEPGPEGPHELVPAEPGRTLVLPEVELAQAIQVWEKFDRFRAAILDQPSCYDVIDGQRQMNRTGATRLAVVFGISLEQLSVEEGTVQLDDSGKFDYRFKVRVRASKGSRFVDGIGSCRISEIPGNLNASQAEHFALTKADTRARKRAIADMLGGTEAE